MRQEECSTVQVGLQRICSITYHMDALYHMSLTVTVIVMIIVVMITIHS